MRALQSVELCGRVPSRSAFRNLLLAFIGRLSLNLAWRLVLGEVELFLDFTLSAAPLSVTLLFKGRTDRTDSAFQFHPAFGNTLPRDKIF
jgi:hypothetical protein